MKLSEMVVLYNHKVDEVVALGGAARRRKAFGQRSEATAALADIEARLPALRPAAAPEQAKKMEEKVLRGREPGRAITPMKADSIRARILQLLDGSRTPAQIATEVGIEQHKVAPHLGSMHKYSGIGYAYDDRRRVRALYPRGGDYQKALRPA